jgi:hypothetical protein
MLTMQMCRRCLLGLLGCTLWDGSMRRPIIFTDSVTVEPTPTVEQLGVEVGHV